MVNGSQLLPRLADATPLQHRFALAALELKNRLEREAAEGKRRTRGSDRETWEELMERRRADREARGR